MNSVDNMLVNESRGGRKSEGRLSVARGVNAKCIGQKKKVHFPFARLSTNP